MNRKWLVTALFGVAMAAGVAACKQGLGERCQQDGDCASGVCSKSDPRVCQGNGSGIDTTQIDATPPVDAPAPPPGTDAGDAGP